MQTFTALFGSRADAERARSELSSAGIQASNASIHDQDSAGFGSSNNSTSSESVGSSSDGGFFGSLRDMFVPDEDSQTYGEGLRRGNVLLTVRADDRQAEQVHRLLENSNALNVDESASSWRNDGWGGPSTTSGQGSRTSGQQGFVGSGATTSGERDQTIPIVEEQLAVGKREVSRGGVKVRSYVKERPIHEQVSLREEHVDIERHPVNRTIGSADLGDAFQERSFEMTESAEEAVVAKNARVVEEVVVHKNVGEHVEQIDDTVRRTEVDVDRIGGTERTSTDRGALFGTDETDRNRR